MDDNTYELAQQIFTKPPQKPFSIQLFFEEETSHLAQKTDIDNFINEVLFLITLHGIEILFGHKNLKCLTEENICLIKQYIHSYGYDVILKDENMKDTIRFIPLTH